MPLPRPRCCVGEEGTDERKVDRDRSGTCSFFCSLIPIFDEFETPEILNARQAWGNLRPRGQRLSTP